MNSEISCVQNYYNKLFNRLGIKSLLDHYTVVPENYADNLEYINFCLTQTNKKLLLATDSNAIDLDCYKKYTNIHPRVKVLSSNVDHFFQDVDYIFFPYFFVTQLLETNFQSPERKSRFSYLSRQPRPHRLYLYQTVKQHITDSDCFSIHANCLNKFRSSKKYEETELYHDIPFYTRLGRDPEYITHFQQDFSSAGDHTNQHTAYSAYFYITGESNDSDNLVFLSEKTWKSFRSYCLPITYGNVGSKKFLEQLGFCLDYDVDEDCLTKATWIAECMHNWDLEYCKNFYEQNLKIVQHNFNYFYSDHLKTKFSNYLKSRLEL
jgi:hypothetical protein